MESLKGIEFGNVIGVPLTCLIEYEGLVAMVKAMMPETAPKVEMTQELMI